MLKSYGEVYTEHVGDEQAIIEDDISLSDHEIHERDLGWIRNSDLLIAEVSVPSLGVGYEIARAVDLDKPVLCLYNQDSEHSLSAMISGCEDVEIGTYKTLSEAKEVIEDFLRKK